MTKNKRKESNDVRLKACLVEKWNEYMGANDELMEQKRCHDDIEKEILKIQNEFGLIFRQREPSAGKSKNKVDYDLQKHEELLENKLHVVRFVMYYIQSIYCIMLNKDCAETHVLLTRYL